MSTTDLLVFESHPVQYKAPVYGAFESLCPGRLKIIYASDFSVGGYFDQGFGRAIAWNSPLMSGYPFEVLSHSVPKTPLNFFSLRSNRTGQIFRRERPRAVLFTQLAYEFEFAAFLHCILSRTPIWIRIEAQDEAFVRPRWKDFVRLALRRMVYKFVSCAFAIGELSRQHLLRHGVPESRIRYARYCVPNHLEQQTTDQLQTKRNALRKKLGVASDQILVAFSGKLIPKKDPALLLAACQQLASDEPGRYQLIFIGDGSLSDTLKKTAEEHPSGLNVHFPGFINQNELLDYYLAADVFVLPSRRMGETWGLVVNEALHAGCAVVVSDAVGCSADFRNLDRVRVIPSGDIAAGARAIRDLSKMPRDFFWCADEMKDYSVESTALALAAELEKLTGTNKAVCPAL